jgi:ABC-type uncharacterized transport system permease subunit
METAFNSSLIVLSVLYTILVMAYARIFAKGAEGVGRYARTLLLVTVAIHFLSILLRGKMEKACPLGSPGEFMALVAFSIAVIYSMLELRIGERTTGVFAIAPAFLLQVIATVRILGQEVVPEAKMGVFRSFHSFFAVVAFSGVAVCGVYGLLYLFLYGAIKAGRFGLFFRKMPPLERLSELNFVATCVAFAALTVTSLMGFWSMLSAQGNTVSALRPEVLATTFLWALYGAAIVARVFFRLGGKRLAYTTVLGSILLVAILLGGLTMGGFHK